MAIEPEEEEKGEKSLQAQYIDQNKNEIEMYGKNEDEDKKTRRKKLITSSAVFYCTFALGVANNMLGPCQIDLADKFGKETEDLSVVFTILTGSYLAGAMSAGFIYNLVHRQVAVVSFLSIMAACLFIIPHLTSMTVFFVVSAILGFGCGGYDTGQVAWIIDIWRGDAAVWILTQHFMYSFGTIVPSLILAPFLRDKEDEDEFSTTLGTTEIIPVSSSAEPKFESKLGVPFTIAGFVVVLGILIQILLYFKNRGNKPPTGEEEEKEVEVQKTASQQGSRARMIVILVLSCCTLGVYQGMEITFLQFIPTFAVYSEVGLSEAEAARVLTGLTIGFAAGRFAGIFIVMRVLPQIILVVNFILIITANLILLLAGQTSVPMLWVGACLLGVSGSTVYPGYYSYIEEHLYVTNAIAAIITVSGGLMGAVYPLIVGQSVKKTPAILVYVDFFSVAVIITAFTTIFWLTKLRKSNKAKESVSD